MIGSAVITGIERVADQMHAVIGKRPDYVSMRRSTWELVKAAILEEQPSYRKVEVNLDGSGGGYVIAGLVVTVDEHIVDGCFIVGYAREAVA